MPLPKQNLRIDVHVHVLGNGKEVASVERDVFFKPEDNRHWMTRLLHNMVEEDLKKLGAVVTDGSITADNYLNLIYQLLISSQELDGIVLLAMDGVFNPENGELRYKETDLWVSNRYLSNKVKELNDRLQRDGYADKSFYFGASVSPNRRNANAPANSIYCDWEAELRYVIEETDAVLLKLIPSTQHIDLEDSRHRPFYQALATAKLPLLCHVGPEYAFTEGIQNRRLDDYNHLKRPLDCGVTVIAAHCAAPAIPILDKPEIWQFERMMRDYNGGNEVRLWADTSALSLLSRIFFLREIVMAYPPEWLIHGSDFPIPIPAVAHLPWLTYDVTLPEYRDILSSENKNPLDKDVMIKRAHRFDDRILKNAGKVLR